MFNHSIVAGTFDHLHKGHQQLLKTALCQSRKVSIGLTKNSLHLNKPLSSLIETSTTRQKNLSVFIQKHLSTTIFPLKNPLEPAASSLFFDAIIASTDTQITVQKINQLRLQKNLPPLKTVIIKLIDSSDKKTLSSTRIRQGQVNRAGLAYHQIFPKNTKLILPPIHRNKLKKPFGLLLKGSLQNLDWASLQAKNILKKNPPTATIAVGDIATLSLLRQKVHLDLSLIDLKTNRLPLFATLNQLGLPSLANHTVVNPPASITPDLIKSLRQSFTNLNQQQVILVKGEEDLSVLPTILLSPLNTAIFYGQPQQGMVYIKVTETTKQKALIILQSFI